MTPEELVETVARAIWEADSKLNLKEDDGDDIVVAHTLAEARAAIVVVVEQAAKVAEECGKRGSQHEFEMAQYIATALRRLSSKGER